MRQAAGHTWLFLINKTMGQSCPDCGGLKMEILIVITSIAFLSCGLLLFVAALDYVPDYKIVGNYGKKLGLFKKVFLGFKFLFSEV